MLHQHSILSANGVNSKDLHVAKAVARSKDFTKCHHFSLTSTQTTLQRNLPLTHRQRFIIHQEARRRSPLIAPGISIGAGEDEMQMDLMNYLLRNRIVFVNGYVNDKMATQIVGSLLALENVNEEEDIRMYINSPGGQPYSIFGVLDVMASIKPHIQTLGLGACYSYSSLLLAAGTKGKRSAMKNTRIMMTQPMGGSQGDWWQISKTVEELNAIYQLCCRFYMKHTGMDQDAIELNTNRDYFMTPEEAKQLNLIDEVIRGKNDFTTPPSVRKQLESVGFVDNLSGGILRV